MLQELSDEELAMVSGSSGGTPGVGNITVITIIENNFSFVYAPVFIIDSTISHSNIDNGNAYVQNSHIH